MRRQRRKQKNSKITQNQKISIYPPCIDLWGGFFMPQKNQIESCFVTTQIEKITEYFLLLGIDDRR